MANMCTTYSPAATATATGLQPTQMTPKHIRFLLDNPCRGFTGGIDDAFIDQIGLERFVGDMLAPRISQQIQLDVRRHGTQKRHFGQVSESTSVDVAHLTCENDALERFTKCDAERDIAQKGLRQGVG